MENSADGKWGFWYDHSWSALGSHLVELFNVFVSIITGATSSCMALNILELMTSFLRKFPSWNHSSSDAQHVQWIKHVYFQPCIQNCPQR